MKEIRRLDYGDRRRIQEELDNFDSLVDMASDVCCAATTISREIKRNRIYLGPVSKSRFTVVTCGNFTSCEVRGLCGSWCKGRCRSCGDVERHTVCDGFLPFEFARAARFPHVCNGCRFLNRCPQERYVYKAREAHKMTLERRSESRRGLDIDSAALEELSKTVAPLLKKGQSVPAVLANHPELRMCPTTLYNYINMGLFAGVSNMTLPRKVKFKKRKRKGGSEGRRQRRDLTGRDYEAFLMLPSSVRASCKEMDTVIGRVGGKCLLTFCMRENEVFYARLLPSKEADAVRDALDDMEMLAADGLVSGELGVMVVLTDRGSEFDRFEDLERGCYAPEPEEKRVELYHCDPYCSWQKPYVENAHTLLRRVLLKGTSFDDLAQDDIDLVCSHINSYPRKELGWETPFEMLPEWGQENLPKAFGMRIVPGDEVNLTPRLLERGLGHGGNITSL